MVESVEKETPKASTDMTISQKSVETFKLVNTKAQSHQVTLSDETISLLQEEKPIILVNLFATWCPPCIGQLAYLNDLQKKHQKEAKKQLDQEGSEQMVDPDRALSKKQKMVKLASEVWDFDTLSQADRFYMERMLKEKCTERFLNLALRK